MVSGGAIARDSLHEIILTEQLFFKILLIAFRQLLPFRNAT
jgi:hypothetical protein